MDIVYKKMNSRKMVSLFYILVFIFLFVFFSKIHPLCIFDTDDWTYVAYTRSAYPIWKNWNPTRVLPEVLMSFVAEFGSFFIYPIIKDFVWANIIANSLVVSIFITIYVVMFSKMIKKIFNYSDSTTIFISSLFFICHFWIFRSKDASNEYMFNGLDLACFYYYVIPNCLNSIIVMKLIDSDVLVSGWDIIKEKPIKNGCLFTAMYFALVSNLYASIILAAYVGSAFFVDFILVAMKKNKFFETLKKNCFRIAIIIFWGFVQLFEMNGGRADSLKKGDTFISLIKQQIKIFLSLKNDINKLFLRFVILTLLIFVAIYIVNKIKYKNIVFSYNRIIILGISMIVTLLYLIIVSSKHYIGSIIRPDVLFGFVFYCFVIIFLMLCYIIKNSSLANIILPLMVCIAFFDTNTSLRTFKETNMRNVFSQSAVDMDNDIISQFIYADENGLDDITLYVPDFNTGDNWPVAVYAGGSISSTLYKHGIISRKINVSEMIPTVEKNVEFGMPIY